MLLLLMELLRVHRLPDSNLSIIERGDDENEKV